MASQTLSLLKAGKLTGARRLDLNEGLTEFPPEIFDLADSLEVLNLSQNRLSELPDDLVRLSKLRILFCSDNPFRRLPEVLGRCPHLRMVGFKACEIEEVSPEALSRGLRWLILTDNRISELPAALGDCTGLQKLMLSGNRLSHLPETMSQCRELELVRLAANRFQTLPDWLLALPRLAWLAIAGNPFTSSPVIGSSLETIDWSAIELESQIGEGASGIIHRAQWRQTKETLPVAVKIFKGAMTSDGLPANELAACLAAGRHPHLVGAMGQVVNHPEGAKGLIMPLIDGSFTSLAGPPDFDTCTRDIYPEGLEMGPPVLIRLALGIAMAAEHLHARNLLHGDLYAHNILWNTKGKSLLGDFGAATFYPTENTALQQLEVRAFGILLEELLNRSMSAHDVLHALKERCIQPQVAERPLFAQITDELRNLLPS